MQFGTAAFVAVAAVKGQQASGKYMHTVYVRRTHAHMHTCIHNTFFGRKLPLKVEASEIAPSSSFKSPFEASKSNFLIFLRRTDLALAVVIFHSRALYLPSCIVFYLALATDTQKILNVDLSGVLSAFNTC